jgi:hypothetical protein
MDEVKPSVPQTEPTLWQRNYEYVKEHWIVFSIMLCGAIASIYFGFWPKYPQRELTYAIQPVRTAIVQVSQPTGIAVTYNLDPA